VKEPVRRSLGKRTMTHLHQREAERIVAVPQQRLAFCQRLVVQSDAVDLARNTKQQCHKVEFFCMPSVSRIKLIR
jgi:hypothetical protein